MGLHAARKPPSVVKRHVSLRDQPWVRHEGSVQKAVSNCECLCPGCLPVIHPTPVPSQVCALPIEHSASCPDLVSRGYPSRATLGDLCLCTRALCEIPLPPAPPQLPTKCGCGCMHTWSCGCDACGYCTLEFLLDIGSATLPAPCRVLWPTVCCAGTSSCWLQGGAHQPTTHVTSKQEKLYCPLMLRAGPPSMDLTARYTLIHFAGRGVWASEGQIQAGGIVRCGCTPGAFCWQCMRLALCQKHGAKGSLGSSNSWGSVAGCMARHSSTAPAPFHDGQARPSCCGSGSVLLAKVRVMLLIPCINLMATCRPLVPPLLAPQLNPHPDPCISAACIHLKAALIPPLLAPQITASGWPMDQHCIGDFTHASQQLAMHMRSIVTL